MRRIAVHAVDRDIQVALLGFGGNAGRGSAAHHVDDHDRVFGRGGQPERLDHQRKSGAGGRRQRRRAAIGCADDHVDRGELVFGLQQHPANLDQAGRQPFEHFGRRRDRIGGGKANAAADGAERGCFVARQQPTLKVIGLGGEMFVKLRLAAASIRPLWRPGWPRWRQFLVGQPFFDRREQLLGGEAEQVAAMPSATMLERPSGTVLASSFIGTSMTRAPD